MNHLARWALKASVFGVLGACGGSPYHHQAQVVQAPPTPCVRCDCRPRKVARPRENLLRMIVRLDPKEEVRCKQAPPQRVATNETTEQELKALDPLAKFLKKDLGKDLRQIERIGDTSLYLATIRPNARASLECNPHVAKASKERVGRAMLDTSVPSIGGDSPAVSAATGKDFIVAVLDSGVAAEHPFLGGRVKELCFAKECPPGIHPAAPRTYHGTHVAGVIAGSPLEVEGADGRRHSLRGVAPQAEILAVQIFDRSEDPEECGSADVCYVSYESSQIRALSYLAAHISDTYPNLAAVNLSIGDGENHPEACTDDNRQEFIDSLTAQGVAVVVATGNNYAGPGVDRPACVPNAIAVAATTSERPAAGGEPDDNNKVPTALQNGVPTDIMAPGVEVFSSTSFFEGKAVYQPGTGTSVAAPHVAGAIAALRSLPSRPLLPQIVRAMLNGPKMPDGRFNPALARPRLDLGVAVETLSAQGGKGSGISRTDDGRRLQPN